MRCRPYWLVVPAVVAAGLTLVPAQAPAKPKKYALLVGVNKYEHTALNQPEPLRYAEADVTALAALLRESGYEVELLTGPRATRQAITAAVAKLEAKGNADGVALVALAGHGVQLERDEDAYYCPYDAKIREAVRDGKKVVDRSGQPILEPAPASCVKLTDVVDRFRLSPAGTRILLADCCRNDPATGRGRGVGSGIKTDRLPANTAVLLSCSQGQRSWEDKKWAHGAFFFHVLKGLREGKRTVASLNAYLEDAVPREVKATLRDAPNQYPHPLINGTRLEFGIVASSSYTVDLGGGVTLELVRIPAGTFRRGSPDGDSDAQGDEKPQREVTISRPFHLGKYEVTVAQFRAFVKATGHKTEAERDGEGGWGYNAAEKKFEGRKPQYTWQSVGWAQTDSHPVVNVSHNDAVAFCQWLAGKTEQKFVLPSEAQWEYACRAGTTTRYHGGDALEDLRGVANVADASYKEKYPASTRSTAWNDGYPFSAPVGRFGANAFGLYDMHGNVWEWCADWYKSEYYKESPAVDPPGPGAGANRVFRGGSFCYAPRYCRAARRYGDSASSRGVSFGFRVALVR